MKLSVSMITYGQEAFIEQTINSVLMQQCDFDFEIILSNDNSPDQTDAIIQRILKTHPEAHKIKYFNQKPNLGSMENFVFTLKTAKGEYIAICEGDDYWTDPLKLQKQVDFLELNPDYSLCFHQGTSFYQNSSKKEDFISDKNILQGIVTPKEIITTGGNMCPTNAIVFRNCIATYPDFFIQTKSGDRALALLLMMHGKFKYFDENMSVYRIHDGGISRNLSTEKLIAFKDSNIELLEQFNVFSEYKFDALLKNEISSQVRNIFIYNFKTIFKRDYRKKITSKHFVLALARIFINAFKKK